MGSSPATGPTQNLGLQAKGIQAAGALVKAMSMVVPLVGAQTELGRAVAEAMLKIGKMLPPGAATPTGEENQLKAQLMRQQQMQPQMAALAQQQPPAPPPQGAPPQQMAA